MHILLTVLAVIGKILLGLLALIGLLLILIFFVALTYKVGVVHETGTGPKDIRVKFGAGWLAGLIKVDGLWEDGATFMKVKLCGFTLKKIGKEPKPKEKPEETASAEPVTEPKPKEITSAAPMTEPKPEEKPAADEPWSEPDFWKEEEKTVKADEAFRPSLTETPGASDNKKETNDAKKTAKSGKKGEKAAKSGKKDGKAAKSAKSGKETAPKTSLRKKLRAKMTVLWQSLCDLSGMISSAVMQAAGAVIDFLTGLPDLLWKLPDSADEIGKKVDRLKEKAAPWLADCSMATYKKIIKELKYLLKHYVPRKAEGHLAFGTGDPAMTAWAGGLIYMILPARSSKFELQPEFYEKYLDADVTVSGHIRLCHVLKAAIALLLDKNVRITIRTLRRARGGK